MLQGERKHRFTFILSGEKKSMHACSYPAVFKKKKNANI